MIQSLSIENFRCFNRLELKKLKHINIIVGKNASGKTTLLEAVKMALHGTPLVIPFINQMRQIPFGFQPNPTPDQFKSFFLDLFSDFNTEKVIQFELKNSDGKTAKLKVYFDQNRAVTIQPTLGFNVENPPFFLPSTIVPLVFDRIDFQAQSNFFLATIQAGGQFFLEPGPEMVPSSGYFSGSSYGVHYENATWFSNLSIQKRDKEVIEALKRHFPFINQITSETIFPGFGGMIYADILGLPRKLPLTLVSAGISRLFTLILAIFTFEKGSVLIDEVENGLFHDQHHEMWKTITDLSIQNNTQLFVSTHSMECLQSVKSIILEKPEYFSLIRIHRNKLDLHSIVDEFDGEQLGAALDKNGEVRD
ncbi:MAG: AAA family ATPase [Leptospirales bacterium]